MTIFNFCKRLALFTALCLSPFAITSNCSAQAGGKGTIQGSVTDQTGAIIPNADVTVVQTETSVTQTQKTTGAGFYSISSLDPGVYNITVTAQGFQKYVQQNVRLDALQVFGVSVQLKLGVASDTVTVNDAPPAIDSTNATLGNTLENETYEALPLNMNGAPRDPTAFVFLTAGVASSSAPYGSFNGGQGYHNEDYIEGLAVTNAAAAGGGNTASISRGASVDAVDQFQVQTSGTSAAYQGQGVENYTLKSGTNQFHGRAFEYFRNTVLDTWGFLSKSQINPATGAPSKPVERQNEYGGTFGGPILRKKLFFFASYDGQRYLKGSNPSFLSVPTTAERAGDFRQLLSGTTGKIFDPASIVCTGSSCVRKQFVSDGSNTGIAAGTANVIPMTRFSPEMLYFLNFVPQPTNSNLTNNYLAGFNTGFNYYKVSVKIDYDLSVRNRLTFLFLTGTRSANPPCCDGAGLPPPFTNTVGNFQTYPTGVIEDTYTINDHFINQFKYGVVRSAGYSTNPGGGSPTFAATASGLTNILPGQASMVAPRIGFSGNNVPTSLGGTANSNNQANSEYGDSFVLYDTMQLVKGRHSMNFGGQYEWLEDNDTALTTGTYLNINYTQLQTADFTAGTNVPITADGAPFASFLLGAVDNLSQVDNRQVLTTGARFYSFSPFFQDDIKATRKLTINAGIRWDLYSPFREVQNRLSFLDPNLINPVTGTRGALTFAGYGPGRCNCDRASQIPYKNFGPHVGFAYQSTPTTVVRGSYNIAFTHDGGVGGRGGARQGASQLGFTSNNTSQETDGFSPVVYLNAQNTALPATITPTQTNSFGTGNTTVPGFTTAQGVTLVDQYLAKRPPYYMNFNFGIQQELYKQATLSLDYSGSVGRFLPTGEGNGVNSDQLDPKYYFLGSLLSSTVNANTTAGVANIAKVQAALPGYQLPYSTFTGTAGQSLRPFPQYSGVTDIYGDFGKSSYNSLQAVLTQRTRAGLSYTVNYTWSKLIDNTGTSRSAYNHQGDRSLSLYDHPQNISGYGVWKEPFGRGHSFVDELIKGYEISGIYTFTSGTPIAVLGANCLTFAAGTCEPYLNPAYTGSGRIGGNYGRGTTAAALATTPFLDSNAFISTTLYNKAPYAYTFGNAPRTAPYGLLGPGGYNINASLRRYFGIYENLKLLMEIDAINLTNRTNFSNPSATLGSTSYGTVGVSGSSRDLQIVARIDF